jgi:hypothetical protein
MEPEKDRDACAKKPYHAPALTTYGDLTELTQTGVGERKPDGTWSYGTLYSNP